MDISVEMEARAIFLKEEFPLHFVSFLPHYDVKLIKTLLDMGASVNKEYEMGQTPLHYFLLHTCSLDIVYLLLNSGAFVNAKNELNFSPLHYAQRYSDCRFTNVLLEKGADVNALSNSYESPLYFALRTWNHNLSNIKLLIEKGANIFLRNKYGDTPLHVAVLRCSVEIINLLLKRGADVNSYNDNGQTPLKEAINACRDGKVVKVLLEGGANIKSPDQVGDYILHIAVAKCKPDIVKLLLDHGASINTRDLCNRTPLNFAIASFCDPGVIKLLLDEGADVNLGDDYNQKPLHLAARQRDVATVKLLLDHGASTNVTTTFNHTPLMEAVFYHYTDSSLAIIKLLLEYGALVHLGSSPLKAAIVLLNREQIRAHTEYFSKLLRQTKFLLKYSLLERPMFDIRAVCDNIQTAEDLLNYRRECLIELNSNCIGNTNLAQFITQQRETENRNLEEILYVLLNRPYSIYDEVLSGQLRKRELREKLNDQIEIISMNPYTVNLNYDCLYNLIKYFHDRDDLLNLALAFTIYF